MDGRKEISKKARGGHSHAGRRGSRQAKGHAIAEFGAALTLLLLFIFFPLVNLLSLGTVYFACFTLNDLQIKAAAERTQTEGQDPKGIVCLGIPEAWSGTGLGKFVKAVKKPETVVTYSKLLPDSKDLVVNVTTTVMASPLLTQPFLPRIPGLSAPMNFVFSSQRVMERSQLSSADQGRNG